MTATSSPIMLMMRRRGMTISIGIRMTMRRVRSDLQIKDQIRYALSATIYSSAGADEELERDDEH